MNRYKARPGAVRIKLAERLTDWFSKHPEYKEWNITVQPEDFTFCGLWESGAQYDICRWEGWVDGYPPGSKGISIEINSYDTMKRLLKGPYIDRVDDRGTTHVEFMAVGNKPDWWPADE